MGACRLAPMRLILALLPLTGASGECKPFCDLKSHFSEETRCNWNGCGGCAACSLSPPPKPPAPPPPPRPPPHIPCLRFCRGKTQPWEQRCDWEGCWGCEECALRALPTCKPFCAEKSQAWEEKCTWGGCPGCAKCGTRVAPRMRVDGVHIRDPTGQIFVPKGVNYGRRSLNDKGEHLYNYSDAVIAKRLLPGLNHVRLVLDFYDGTFVSTAAGEAEIVYSEDYKDAYQPFSPSTCNIKPGWLKYMDDIVGWLEQEGVYVTIALRNNWGTVSTRQEAPHEVPCESDYIGNATALGLWLHTWRCIASRYLNRTNIAWYEPASEPHVVHRGTKETGWSPCWTPNQVRHLFDQVVSAIRTADPAIPIAATPSGYCACHFSEADKLSDPNVIYVLNWSCSIGKIHDHGVNWYGQTSIPCVFAGAYKGACIKGCPKVRKTKDYRDSDRWNYTKEMLAGYLEPAIAFQREHQVPLWVDQIMCPCHKETGGRCQRWIEDSLELFHSELPSFNFDWWTWKGDALGDPETLSILAAPSKGARFDLANYTVDPVIHDVYRRPFTWKAN